MPNLKQLIPILWICILFTNCQDKSPRPAFNDGDSIPDRIDRLVTGYYIDHKFSGSVLVANQGNVLLNKEYGYLDLDSTRAINKASVFEIASLSKSFTALLIMMLEEEEKLDFDDKIIQYFPNLSYVNCSIRHLLTHTSGLSERQFFGWAGQNMDPAKIYSNEFILTYLEQENPQLAFQPGEQWEYSNLAYFLLPLIMKQVTGKHYIQLLREKIFEPLEMNHTGIFSQEVKGNGMENYAFGKVMNPNDSLFISSFGMAWSDSLYGGVGILSNTTDLLKWDRALYTNVLVAQDKIREAFEPTILSDGSSSNYGFGWYIRENYMIDGTNCGKRVDHQGLWPGYESSMVRYIEHDKTIIILANQAPSVKDKLLEEISAILFKDN